MARRKIFFELNFIPGCHSSGICFLSVFPYIIASIQRTTANLDETSAQLKGMMHKDVPQILTKVNKMADNFEAVSGNLRNIDFAATIASVNQTLANLASATNKLNSKEGTLGLLLNDKTLYVNLSNMTGSANDLMVDLKAHPKRYVHFSVFGKKDK